MISFYASHPVENSLSRANGKETINLPMKSRRQSVINILEYFLSVQDFFEDVLLIPYLRHSKVPVLHHIDDSGPSYHIPASSSTD